MSLDRDKRSVQTFYCSSNDGSGSYKSSSGGDGSSSSSGGDGSSSSSSSSGEGRSSSILMLELVYKSLLQVLYRLRINGSFMSLDRDKRSVQTFYWYYVIIKSSIKVR